MFQSILVSASASNARRKKGPLPGVSAYGDWLAARLELVCNRVIRFDGHAVNRRPHHGTQRTTVYRKNFATSLDTQLTPASWSLVSPSSDSTFHVAMPLHPTKIAMPAH